MELKIAAIVQDARYLDQAIGASAIQEKMAVFFTPAPLRFPQISVRSIGEHHGHPGERTEQG
jgi:hypothetical protein